MRRKRGKYSFSLRVRPAVECSVGHTEVRSLNFVGCKFMHCDSFINTIKHSEIYPIKWFCIIKKTEVVYFQISCPCKDVHLCFVKLIRAWIDTRCAACWELELKTQHKCKLKLKHTKKTG